MIVLVTKRVKLEKKASQAQNSTVLTWLHVSFSALWLVQVQIHAMLAANHA